MKGIPSIRILALAWICCFAQGQGMIGKPCLFNEYFPEWRCFPAILRDAQGHLNCGRYRLNQGGATLAPAAAGPVCATSARHLPEAGPQFHFAYRDPEGGIQDLWHTRIGEKDQWHFQTLNLTGATSAPAAAGNPSGLFCRKTYHLIYREGDGGIQDLAYDGNTWHCERLNHGGRTFAPAAAGDPVQLQLQNHRHVLYRDLDGGIQDLWFDQGWHAQKMNNGGLTHGPAAAGEPAGLDHPGSAHVTYRDQEGQVQDIYYDGVWKVQRLTGGGRTGAPAAAGDPGLMLLEGGVHHVTYRDLAGAIQDLWFDGAWHVQRLNNGGETDAPPAASEPCLLVPPSEWEYVAYVDIHGVGQLLTHFPEKGWAAIPLDANTPPGGPIEKWRPNLIP